MEFFFNRAVAPLPPSENHILFRESATVSNKRTAFLRDREWRLQVHYWVKFILWVNIHPFSSRMYLSSILRREKYWDAPFRTQWWNLSSGEDKAILIRSHYILSIIYCSMETSLYLVETFLYLVEARLTSNACTPLVTVYRRNPYGDIWKKASKWCDSEGWHDTYEPQGQWNL